MELPYLNINLEDLPEEIWKDIPIKYLHGQYEVSNMGRIKSLARTLLRKNGFPHPVNERILKQGKKWYKNDKTNKNNFWLFVCLPNGKGGYKTYDVGYLVLRAFKKPDQFNDTTHRINFISYDNRLQNLTFENMHIKRQMEYDNGIRKYAGNLIPATDPRSKVKLLTKADHLKNIETRKKDRKQFRGKYKYPITVYIRKTKSIFTYSSIRNATDQLNIPEYTIRNALANPHKYKYIQVKKGIFGIKEFNPK